MPVTLREEDVDALKTALQNGAEELGSTLETLKGQAVERIHSGLEGTKTADAFDAKITELSGQLKEALPAFDSLGEFVVKYLEGFNEMDDQQATGLSGS